MMYIYIYDIYDMTLVHVPPVPEVTTSTDLNKNYSQFNSTPFNIIPN